MFQIAGLPAIPTSIMVNVSRTNFETEGVQITVEWLSENSAKRSGQTLYIVEERHLTGKWFREEKLSRWMTRQRTSQTAVEIQRIHKPGRWFQFRVTAVNENGTRGPSSPSRPIFSFKSKHLDGIKEIITYDLGCTEANSSCLHSHLKALGNFASYSWLH